jgi:lipopolysaccharide biosynthesis glycosyltransferase
MGELLPPEIRRVLYLDCDVIVRGDLSELWNVNLSGKTVAAVREVTDYTWHSRLGLPAGAPYFNNGVMLIDLDRWRKLNIGRRSLDFAREHPDRVQWWDQCALNLNLYDDWIPLDAKWNFQTMEVAFWDHGMMRFKRIDSRTRDAITITHFTTESKPWQYLNYHPLKGEYVSYRNRTPWPLENFEDRYPHNMMRLFLHRYLPPLLPIYLAARKIV